MLDNLYENIGGKIKGLAKWTFIVEAIGAIITGIVMIIGDSTNTIYALPIIFFGPIVAWVSSWILYGFGELIDNTSGAPKKELYDVADDIFAEINCPKCGVKLPLLGDETSIVCPCCKTKINMN